MKLYYSQGACSIAPHIVLREAGLPHELERVDLRSHKTQSGKDFYEINPKGYVPTLQLDDGSILTELQALLPYLADLAPEKGLAPPAGDMNRYRLHEWLGFVGTEIHKAYSPLFNPSTPEEVKSAQLSRLSTRYAFVAKSLEGKRFLMGEQFTVADAYLFAPLNWSRRMGPDISQWPELSAYFERLLTRPSVRDTMAAEGLKTA